MRRTKIIAEIGINHNGSVDIAKRLIDAAILAGCDYAKFQKRTPDICVPENQKSKLRDTPWGTMAYIDYKKKIEFEKEQYDELFSYVEDRPIEIFASVWDENSAEFMSKYTDIAKLGSASITDLSLCRKTRDLFKTVIISTGMSNEEEIELSYENSKPDVIMHTNSTYPTPIQEINLGYINWLKEKWGAEVGYSGHEYGLVTTFAAVAMGATWVERHVTLDRTMWGSDQLASVEPHGLIKLVKGIRDIDMAMQGYGPRSCYPGEVKKRESLRK